MRDKIWHAAYVRWYDNDKAGNQIRARIWGRISDTLCVVFWPLHRDTNRATR